ncbi:hypothetical protein HAZT_HAZT010909 [Hyalella azteca]|uniref:DNA topoisomerase (ATP-hydrolyzing) n=1 Tax=Hyalella azteca TaxID=294128 RepID=A0A6A0H0X6_HYAAZ|nr:hypothetical protein HAZT_HAZT010909 [Hyalella azteca]
MIVNTLQETLSKNDKSGVQIENDQIKNHLWVFVNAQIVKPEFESLSKETVTLQQKSFYKFKLSLSNKFVTAVGKSGIVEFASAKLKQFEKKRAGNATSKHLLVDANNAGNGSKCTLILTESKAVAAFAISGLSEEQRDNYGIYNLRTKFVYSREGTSKMNENIQVGNLVKAIGLEYNKRYKYSEEIKTLRYQHIMLMTTHASMSASCVINFIHDNWPCIIQLPFISAFKAPIVKAAKLTEKLCFFSQRKYEEWKSNKNDWRTYKIKYYKDLGAHSAQEAKEYFRELPRHRIMLKYDEVQDDRTIQMAFCKNKADQRKEIEDDFMKKESERRRKSEPPETIYETTGSVNFSDFVRSELELSVYADNERSIPSLVDGLKPGQRKVMFTCIKRNDQVEVNVAQLAGSVTEHTAYHQDEASLSIISLAQNFVGSNNVNLLEPIGG